MASRRKSGGVRIVFRLGRGGPTTVPVAHGPTDSEDLAAFVSRIGRHAGITWDRATVRLADGSLREVATD